MLSVRDLTVVTMDGRSILEKVSFDVPEDTSVGLVGESGSGKSMTVKAVLGLLPRGLRVAGGSIALGGMDMLGRTARQLAAVRGRTVGYIPQDPFAALNPVLRVGEQITEIHRLHRDRRTAFSDVVEVLRGYRLGRLARRERGQAREMLEAVRIRDADTAANQFPHSFSGGMRQRAVIASATALSPRLLIADEPTTALDASVEKAVLDLMKERRRAACSSLLLVSHDLDVIAWMCDRVVVMHRGTVVEQGETREILGVPRHPYTRLLAESSKALRVRGTSRERLRQAREDFAAFNRQDRREVTPS